MGIVKLSRSLGVVAAAEIVKARLLHHPEIALHPANVAHPIHLRWRTTDVDVYRDILVNEGYGIEFGFTPKTIIDAGAHIGTSAVYFAHRFPDAQIVSIEPEPSNYELLCRNVAPYPNIRTIQAALRDKEGTVALEPLDYQLETYSFRMIPGEGIPSIDMPTLLNYSGFSSVDIFKIDIEGSERELFANCDWLPLVKAIVIELHDRWVPNSGDHFRQATAQGFRIFQSGEYTVAIRN